MGFNSEDFFGPAAPSYSQETFPGFLPSFSQEDWTDSFLKKKKILDTRRLDQEQAAMQPHDAITTLDQFLGGAVQDVTFGLVKAESLGVPPPFTPAEKIARGLGSFAGFLVPVGVAGKVVKTGIKATKAFPTLLKLASEAPKWTKLIRGAEPVITSALTLGGGTALADITRTPQELAQAGAQGAAMGAVFGMAGLAHWPDHKVLSWIGRQFGGRAALALVGQYQPPLGEGAKQDLVDRVFSEVMNTFFLSQHININKFNNPETPGQLSAKAELMGLVADFDAHTEAGARLMPGPDFFKVPEKQKISLFDLIDDTDVVDTSYNHFRKTLAKGIHVDELTPIPVEWDTLSGRYRAKGYASLIKALRDDHIQNQVEGVVNEVALELAGGDISPEVTVMVTRPKPPEQPKLMKAMQTAQMYGQKVVSTDLLRAINDTGYVMLDTKTGIFSPLRHRALPPAPKKNEILFVRGAFDRSKGLVSFVPAARGRDVLPFEGKNINYVSRYDKYMEGNNILINQILNKYPKDTSPEGMIPDDANAIDSYKFANERLMLKNIQVNAFRTDALKAQGVKGLDLDKITEKAEQFFNQVFLTRNEPLPDSYLLALQKRIDRLGMGISLAKVARLLPEKPDNDIPLIRHLPWLEDKLLKMEEAPRGDALGILMFEFRLRANLTHPELTGEYKERQAMTDWAMNKSRTDFLQKALWNQSHVQGSGNVIQQALTYSRLKIWQNVGRFFAHLQDITRIPFYDLHKAIGEGRSKVTNDLISITDQLNRFYQGLTPIDQAQAAAYFFDNYRGKTTDISKLSPIVQEYIGAIDNMMHGEFAPGKSLPYFVARYHMQLWEDLVLSPRISQLVGINQELPNEPIIFHSKRRQRELEPLLLEGWKVKNPTIGPIDEAAYDQWIRTHQDQLGTITEGAYVPIQFLFAPHMKLESSQIMPYIDTMSHGHVKARGINAVDDTLMDNLETTFTQKHMNARLFAYVRQILNLTYIEPAMKSLNELSDIFREELDNAKPIGLGRSVPESRTMSMMDYLKVYAHRQKGYPIKAGPIGEGLKYVQSLFFRSLTVRPFLWLRNMPQMIVTDPHKETSLDPRYFGKGLRDLPPDVREWYTSRGLSQEGAMRQHYLELQSTQNVKQWPILGPLFTFAEKVGNVYSVTDTINRGRVYAAHFLRGTDYINDFKAGKIDMEAMENHLGVEKMGSAEQRVFRENVEVGNIKEAAFTLAKWMSMESQWWYNRPEKSLAEMTGEGEAWTNLLTWSKGIIQEVADCGKRLQTGFNMVYHGNTPQERAYGGKLLRSGAGQFAGIMLAGMVANELLATISISHATTYKSYGTDMFIWELGGVTVDIVKQLTSTLSDVALSFNGTKEKQTMALGKAMKLFDTVAIRQLLPFAKNALSVVESVTGRSFISPLYEKYTKVMQGYPAQKTFVSRTMLEGIAHGIFSIDPAKTEDVRRWTYKTMIDYQKAIYNHPDSMLLPYYKAQYELYKYKNDLFMRYTPMESFIDTIKKENLKNMQRIKNMTDMYSTGYKYQRDWWKALHGTESYGQ